MMNGAVLEGAKCSNCMDGTYGFPNDHWREVLKTLRCDYCFDEALHAELAEGVRKRMEQCKSEKSK